jgi:2-iminobutanoate/2-iminopropanoate deaminase
LADGGSKWFEEVAGKTRLMMTVIKHNPSELYPPYRAYAHAVELLGDARLLIISGLNGYLVDGKTMPESFQEQGELIWEHMGTLLKAAAMDYQNIVSLRTYLADPQDDEANVQLRMKYMGQHQTASTVVCCKLLDARWKLEIEAMAAK